MSVQVIVRNGDGTCGAANLVPSANTVPSSGIFDSSGLHLTMSDGTVLDVAVSAATLVSIIAGDAAAMTTLANALVSSVAGNTLVVASDGGLFENDSVTNP